MTVSELLNKGTGILKEQNVENCENEARWIFESVFGGREVLIFSPRSEADKGKADLFLEKISQRASGLPVQYVIGEWDFYGESFNVGKGVLIPRPETEMLVDYALEYLKDKKSPVIYDLCAGTGCIGLTLARLIPDSKVFLLEKSPEAFRYLESNKARHSLMNAELISGDLFSGYEFFSIPKPDLILSNPPYIESEVIPTLQSEVQLEPSMALDGGEDGLDFYRAIAEKWLPYCNGAIAVECGEGQTAAIKDLFSDYCTDISEKADFNGIGRIVCGRKV